MAEKMQRYGGVAQLFHWLIALLMAGVLAIAFYMTSIPQKPENFVQILQVYGWHKSLGVTVFALMTLRLVWRLTHRPPPHVPPLKPWQALASHAVHWALYLLLLVQPVVGVLQSQAKAFPVSVFGLVQIPAIVQPDPALDKLLLAVHWYGGMAILALLAAHIGGAIYHHVVEKDGVLLRMLPGGRKEE